MNDIKIPDGGKKGELHNAPSVHGDELHQAEPGERVKVKFEKFVQLVATHDVGGIMKRYENEDVILSTNLLTDLANAHEDAPDPSRKLPIIFIIGIILGIVITYVVVRLH